jgi:RHS repeat-associated protein
VALADASGTVQTEYTYEPFGKVTASGGTSGNSITFSGREADGTGSIYYRSRYYDSRTAAFLSEDSIGLLGGFNLYEYAGRDPRRHRDPLGFAHTWFECWAKCIERRTPYSPSPAPAVSAWPKRLLPPFRVADPRDRLTTPLSSLAFKLRRIAPGVAVRLRAAGRVLSWLGTPLLLLEGAYDWYVLIDCAAECGGLCES